MLKLSEDDKRELNNLREVVRIAFLRGIITAKQRTKHFALIKKVGEAE